MSLQRLVERLEPLLASFAASDLTHFEMRDGDFAVELVRRNPQPLPTSAPAVAAAPATLTIVPPVLVSNEHIVRAELVGVVRLIKPVLTEGLRLERDREVATIESLGVKSPVLGSSGTRVTRVLVSDGDAVDYGQALFVVERV